MRPTPGRWTIAAAAAGLVLSSACRDDAGMLVVDLSSPATASRQYFHGNCFAGWSVSVDLRARETGRVDVFLDSLSYRLVDQSASQELSADVLDREAIEARYGSMASVVHRQSSALFSITGVAGQRPAGPLAVTGRLAGRDEHGHRVDASFELSTNILVSDGPPPSGGACASP